MKNAPTRLLILLAIVLSQPQFLTSQNAPNEYHETMGMAPIPVNPAHRRTSPPHRIFGTNFFATQVNVDANGNNIIGDAANEPSIALDPTNPMRMAIGWRQFDTIASDFRQAGHGFTIDGGQTWTFPGVIDPGIFRSDPVLDSDDEGRFYYNSLTLGAGYSTNVYRSTGDGTWDNGPYAFGGDKQWMVIDKTGGEGNGNIYSNWNSSFSICPPGNFTRSTDGGGTYEACTEIPLLPYWGNLDVGPEGEVYAVGDGATFTKSTNAQNAGETPSWTGTTADIGGYLQGFNSAGPNPSGLLGQTWVGSDHSGGPNHGNIYVLASVVPNDGSDVLNVHFIRSLDGGLTWSSPIRVNDDTGNNWQWFGTMSVAPNGRIDAVWLDTRDHPGTFLSSLYYSYSEDGGLTWSPNERLSEAFDPHVGWPIQQKMGDYFHMVSDNEGAHLAWAATFNGEEDVYYGRIVTQPSQTVSAAQTMGALLPCYPNPVKGTTTIPFQLNEAADVTLAVRHQTGQLAKVLIEKIHFQAGSHAVTFDGTDGQSNRLPAGLYYYEMQVDGQSPISGKMVLLR
ncbi:MAG: hypothetical protein IT258_23930 [Saprospiraceae bacterium]|nr:hypothetical protein [Saprospiraceae bacterium]